RAARREFTKVLGLTSLTFVMTNLAAAIRKLWRNVALRRAASVPIANLDEVAVGGYKLFRYPTENDPCILLRPGPSRFVAFNQSCPHLACPVHFNADTTQLECPCHRGFFSAQDGRPLAGPSTRPLARISVSIRNGQVCASD